MCVFVHVIKSEMERPSQLWIVFLNLDQNLQYAVCPYTLRNKRWWMIVCKTL